MKTSLLYAICFLAQAAIVSAQISTDGLVRYYPFNESAADYTPNAQHGTVVGATLTTDRFGHPSAAYSFNGISDYIQIPAADLLFNQYTYSVWAQMQETPPAGGKYMVFNIGSGGGDQYVNVNNYYEGLYNGWESGGYNNNGTIYFSPSGSDAVANQWVHLVSVRTATGIKFYLNGVLAGGNGGAATVTPYYGSNPGLGYIGMRNNYTFNFKGKIDDVRIYNRPITEQEVIALYNEGLCFQSIAVTDTLIINTTVTGYNPLTYQHSIKIFPNPTSDHIYIDCGSNYASLSGYTIKITNAQGQQVYQTLLNQQQFLIDLSGWSGNGTYFIYIIDAQGHTIDVRKIILQ